MKTMITDNKIDIVCTKHPTYKGIRYPKACCEACRLVYYLVNGEEYWMDDGSTLRVKDNENLSD